MSEQLLPVRYAVTTHGMRSLLILILALETSANIIAQDDGKLLFADGGRHKYSTEYREWRDASGNFAVIAKFDRFLPADHVRLIRKNEDKPADVKIEILSPQDQELLNQIRKLIEKEAAGDNEARLAKGVWGRRIDFDAKAGEGGRYVTINGRTNLPPETKLQASMTPKWPIDEQCLPLHRPNLLKKGNYVTPSHVTKSGEGTVDEAGNFEIQIFFKDDSKLKYGEYHVFVSYLGGFMNTVTEKEIYEFLDGEGVSSGRERRVLAQVYRLVTILDNAI